MARAAASDTSDPSRTLPPLRALLALLVLSALPHLPSLFDPLFADDYLHIERTADLRSGSPGQALRSWVLRAEDAAAWWTQPDLKIEYFRPLVSVSFLLDHAIWGLRAFGYHATNLVLHLVATLLCWGLAVRFLGPGFSAWAAAVLFGIFPAHTEAIAWVSGRTDLLGAVFFAAALLCLAPPSRRAPAGAFTLLCGAGLAFLALLAKEMAVTLPAVVLLAGLCVRSPAPVSRRLLPAGIAAAVTLGYLLLRLAVLGGFQAPPHPFAHAPGDPDFLQHLLLSPILYAADLVLFVPPDPVVTYPFWLGHPVLLGALALLTGLTLAGSIRAVPDARVRLIALGWTVVTLLPVLPVSVGERFVYLPSMGYCLLVAGRLPRTTAELGRQERRGVLGVGLLVLVVALVKALVFSALAGHSRQAIDDALAAIDRAPLRSIVLVADLPAASALAFPHALRLERPDRHLDIEVLSLAPDFLADTDGQATAIVRQADGSLVLRAPGDGFFGSYIEQAYLAQRPPFREGDSIQTPRISVSILKTKGSRVLEFQVRLQRPAEQVLLLQGHGFRLQRVELE